MTSMTGVTCMTRLGASKRLWCALAVAVSAAPAMAQCGGMWVIEPLMGEPGLNAGAACMTMYDPDGAGPAEPVVAMGGSFDIAGTTYASGVVVRDGGSWRALGAGLRRVLALVQAPNGDLIAAGEFNVPAGDAFNYVARWDGTAWRDMGGGLNGAGNALAVYAGQVYVGGAFTSASGQDAFRLARWNGSMWQALPGEPLRNLVSALQVYGDDLIVGGEFEAEGSFFVARWNGSAWLPMSTGVNGYVRALGVHGGELIAGGDFVMADGKPALRVAAWDGSEWRGLGAGIASGSAKVYSIGEFQGDLIVGGEFLTAGGELAKNIARWDGSAWSPLQPGADNRVRAMLERPGELLVGSSVKAGGVLAEGVASWDGSAWSPLSEGTDSTIRTTAMYDGELVGAGLRFATTGVGAPRDIGVWDGERWIAKYQGLPEIDVLGVYQGELIAAAMEALYRWNGSAWESFATTTGDVTQMLEYNGRLYVAGQFGTIDGIAAKSIASWDGAMWRPLGSGLEKVSTPVAVGEARALEVYNGELVVAGSFGFAGGMQANGIARWDGMTWRPLGQGASSINALIVYGGELIAGGGFSMAGGVAGTGMVAAWDGSAWKKVGAGLGARVHAYALEKLAIYNGDLIGVGRVDLQGGISDGQVVRWNGSAWGEIPTPTIDPIGYSPLSAIGVSHGELLLFGYTLRIGDQVSAHWARWRDATADLNGDGVIDFADYLEFLNLFDAGDPRADFTMDGVVDFADYLEFLNLFDGGC